jgi:branched-chain amino acid aminotransferase
MKNIGDDWMKSFVFYQGKIINENEVNISIRCKALNYGLGCFEGIRAYYDSTAEQLYAFKLEDHYKRFLDSCKILNIKLPYTVEDLSKATVELLKANGYKCNVYIRPMAFKGSDNVAPSLLDDDDRIVIYCQPMNRYASKEALSVCVSSWNRLHDNALPARAKITGSYVNSALANMEAIQNGYDEAIFLTAEGYVAEGSSENIFLVRDGKLLTPAASECILEGITRKLVIELAKNELNLEVIERRIARTELYSAEEVFFSGTAMEVTPVIEVDKRTVGNGETGPVYREIKELFSNLTIGKLEKYASYCTAVY